MESYTLHLVGSLPVELKAFENLVLVWNQMLDVGIPLIIG